MEGVQAVRRFVLIVVLLGIGYLFVQASFIDIPDGHVGVATNRFPGLRAVYFSARSMPPGVHLSIPFLSRIHLYSTRLRILTLDVEKDDVTRYRMSAQIRLIPDSSVLVHDRLGPDYLSVSLGPLLSAHLQDEVFSVAAGVVGAGAEHLKQSLDGVLARNGFILEGVLVTQIGRADASDDKETGPDEDEE